MRIPIEKSILQGGGWESEWERAAIQIAMETGVLVEVGVEYETRPGYMWNYLVRIFFTLNGHEFETLQELRRAIENKAFL
jgi:hypothetical protein